jgi:DNA-binding CsgD family transcriptional regulator/PAS domain-containing protein
MIDAQTLSTLIGSIYDCALDPARWDETLVDFRGALNCQTAGLQLVDLGHNSMLLNRTAGIEPYWREQQVERARMAEALDALRCGVVLADARGAILHANDAAESMLQNSGPIQGSGGVLLARDPSAARELSAAIRLAADDESGIGKTGLAISLTEPGTPPVIAHVLPLTGSDLRTRLQPAAVAAVFISPPPDEQGGAAATAAAFGLTPAETHVLASLLAGSTLAETAMALDIAASTAKTHLDHIFSKTGVTARPT